MSLEIRELQLEDLQTAAGLSRYVFDYCLRNRMEFEQSIVFIEEYISEEHLKSFYEEEKIVLWGAFDENEMVAVAGLQTDGLITMLYVLPAYQNKGCGARLLFTMREYAKSILGLERVNLNATPAWTNAYFAKNGFRKYNVRQNLYSPFISMYAEGSHVTLKEKRRVPWQVIFFAVAGSLLFATTAGVLFMISYLF